MKRVGAAISLYILVAFVAVACSPTTQDDSSPDRGKFATGSSALNQAADGRIALPTASDHKATCYEATTPADMALCGTSIIPLERFDDAPIYWRAQRDILPAYGEIASQIGERLAAHERRLAWVKGLPPEQFEAGLRAAGNQSSAEIRSLCALSGPRAPKFGREIGYSLIKQLAWMKYRQWLIEPQSKDVMVPVDKLLELPCLLETEKILSSENSSSYAEGGYNIPYYFARPLSLYAFFKSRPHAATRMWLLAELTKPDGEESRCLERKVGRDLRKGPYLTAPTHLAACIIHDAANANTCLKVVKDCMPNSTNFPWNEIASG